MTGTSHHRQERLRREAEAELRDRQLPSWKGRVLQRIAVEHGNGWYPLLNESTPNTAADRPDAVVVGPLGVLVVLLRDAEPDWEDTRRAFVWTAELLAGATTDAGAVTEAVARVVVVHPADHRGRTGHTGEHLPSPRPSWTASSCAANGCWNLRRPGTSPATWTPGPAI